MAKGTGTVSVSKSSLAGLRITVRLFMMSPSERLDV